MSPERPRHIPSFWKNVPRGSLFVVGAGVGLSLASLAFLMDVLWLGARPVPRILADAMVFFASGVLLVLLSVSRRKAYLIGLLSIASHIVYWTVVSELVPYRVILSRSAPTVGEVKRLQEKLVLDYAGCVFAVMGAYSMFWLFINREGKRYGRAHTEMELARGVHDLLVPQIHRSTEQYEFYGLSNPSGAMGGDLVDLVIENDFWVGYVGDVAGHGVAAGVVMAMVKSAARTSLRQLPDGQLGPLLDNVNLVLRGVGKPSLFVTMACLRGDGSGRVVFSLAGHLPVLHYQRSTGAIVETSISQPALGLLANQLYSESAVNCDPGDLLVLLSDGYTEVFDIGGNQLGLAPIKAIVGEHVGKPLAEIAAMLGERIRAHGMQHDDESILLVRRLD